MTVLTVLDEARTALLADNEPGGATVYTALLVAARLASHAAAETADRDVAAAWDFCALSLHEALAELPAAHRDTVALTVNYDELHNIDADALANRLAALVDQLSVIFTHAGSDVHQQVAQRWMSVAARLENAAAEMP